MNRVLQYIIILGMTAVATFVVLSAELFFFNGMVDYSVAAGTSFIMAPLLTLFLILYAEVLRKKIRTRKMIPLIWLAIAIIAIGTAIAAPEYLKSVLFYVLPIGILVPIELTYIRSVYHLPK